MTEADLFPPLSRHFEEQGYQVFGEVGACDLVARREGRVVAVELKLRLELRLLAQAVRRQRCADYVYLAVPASTRRGGYPPNYRDARLLLARLGLGLLILGRRGGVHEAIGAKQSPAPMNHGERKRLVAELDARRVPGPVGGSPSRGEKLTAYRQEALYLAMLLSQGGASTPRKLRHAGADSRAGAILLDNHYGWFTRERRGWYSVSPAGREALSRFGNVVSQFDTDDGRGAF